MVAPVAVYRGQAERNGNYGKHLALGGNIHGETLRFHLL